MDENNNVVVRVPEQQFVRGEDGYSPVVTIEEIEHGHSVNITDREHPEGQSFDVLDGASAYEQAVAGGYTGTEAQFNEDLSNFKTLHDETEEAAPFYAVYGITTASEISSALNRKGQVFLRTLDERSIAPFITEFRWSRPGAAGRGFRFAKVEGTVQYVYELADAWTSHTNDLAAPVQRAEEAAAQALNRMNSASSSADAARDYANAARSSRDGAIQYASHASSSASSASSAASRANSFASSASSAATTAAGRATAASDSATAAANSATAAGNAQTAAETAQGKAEDAQEAAETAQGAAETAAQSVSQSAAQISQNASDISDLKSAVDEVSQATTATTIGPAPIATFDASAADMPLKSLTVNIEPVQAGTGDPSPDNVRPISGWTAANVMRTGENVLVQTVREYRSQFLDVNINVDSAVIIRAEPVTEWLRVKLCSGNMDTLPAGTYTLSSNSDDVDVAISVSGTTAKTMTVVSDGTFVFDNIRMAVRPDTALSNVTVHFTLTASDIFAVTVPFHDSQGDPLTVYGGTLDVVNRKLTVNRVLVTLDGSNSAGLTWGTDSADLASIRFDTSVSPYLRMMFGSPLQSNYLTKIAPRSSQPWTIELSELDIVESAPRMWIKIPSNVFSSQDLNGVLAYFTEHPLQICYELATPIVYDLSDIPKIATLLGTNNIWADCGDVTVTYGAYLETVKAYADKVGDSILSAIAPLEASYIASRAYAVGTFLFVGTKFYKVTQAIAEGGTITPGTNAVQTTVAEQLMALAVKPAILG